MMLLAKHAIFIFALWWLRIGGLAPPPPPIVREPWLRIREIENTLILETRSRLYQSRTNNNCTVDLVSVVHVGEAGYFKSLANRVGGVTLYESIVDEELISEQNTLLQAVRASETARLEASRCGLLAQSELLGKVAFEQGWIIADARRNEAIGSLPPSGWVEALKFVLQGRSGQIGIARLACFLAPAPELSLAVIDWSNAIPQVASSTPSPAVIDTTALRAAVGAIFTGGEELRARLARLSLLRGLMGAVSRDLDVRDEAPIVLQRNEILLEYLDQQIAQAAASKSRIRVIYGAMHMRDLEKRLRDRGFVPLEAELDTSWLQAFAVPLAPPLLSATETLKTLAPFFILCIGLLTFDAADYVFSVFSLVEPQIHFEPKLAEIALYAMRHAALYYALTKFLVA